MAQVLTMPMMGNTMETGVVVEWVISEGETVSHGEPIVIVESEKTSNEVVAENDGVLASIDASEGTEVPPGTRLGTVLGPDEEEINVDRDGKADAETVNRADTATAEPGDKTAAGDDDSASYSGSGPRSAGRIPAAPGARKRARNESVSLEAVEGTGPDDAVLIADLEDHLKTEPSDIYTVASPHVRRLARELGVDLEAVGSAIDHDRISESDVRRAAADVESGPGPGAARDTETTAGPVDPESFDLTVSERRQLGEMRTAIARRMSRSTRQKPHVTLNRSISVDRALETVSEYAEINEEFGLTDLLVCATVEALETHPRFNAWYDDGTLSLIEETNIGVAVDIEDGLVTPVLRAANEKTPTRLAEERAGLTAAVQEGRFTSDDIEGGTFTITNLGMFGVDSFDPIINPPQIAILGVGRIRGANDGRELTLSLSFDHRAVDGADAARFLDSIAQGLTAPTVLVDRRLRSTLG